MNPQTAKIFMNERIQAVRLPKAFRFEAEEVFIHRESDQIILTPKPRTGVNFLKKLMPAENSLTERIDEPPQGREDII